MGVAHTPLNPLEGEVRCCSCGAQSNDPRVNNLVLNRLDQKDQQQWLQGMKI